MQRRFPQRWSVQGLVPRFIWPTLSEAPKSPPAPALEAVDLLTGVMDRYGFADRLERMRQGDLSRSVVLAKVDIREFHQINISYGYEVGDELLIETATRLRSLPGAIVGRLGGNEFALAYTLPTGVAAGQVVAAISNILKPSFDLAKVLIRVRFALGYAVAQADPDTMTLLRQAGVALANSKASGEEVKSFDAATDAEIRGRVRMTNDLHQAIARREFELHYQPKVDIATGALIGAEALIRWRHPVFGLLPPDRFITLAEQTGMIVGIGEWATREVIGFAARINKGRASPLVFALNVSGLEFSRADVVERIAGSLGAFGAKAEWITVELTESALAESSADVLGKLRELRALGVGLAIDDFGTGYSSLGYLDRFPISEIKIDKSFVRGMSHRTLTRAIVTSVIDIARELPAQVTAEGIETESERAILLDSGCRFGQGYLFSPPLPLGDFLLLCLSGQSTSTACSYQGEGPARAGQQVRSR